LKASQPSQASQTSQASVKHVRIEADSSRMIDSVLKNDFSHEKPVYSGQKPVLTDDNSKSDLPKCQIGIAKPFLPNFSYRQGPMLQNFLRPQFTNFRNKLERLSAESLSSLV